MTRKRFTKLLMAQGYSRNEANSTADLAIALKPSYEAAYTAITTRELVLPRQIDTRALEAALRQIGDTAWRICEAFTAGMQAFCKAYSERMAAE